MNQVTNKRVEKEFQVTKQVLDNIKIAVKEDHELYKAAVKCLDTAKRYYNDALYFDKRGDKFSAWGALNYAHGWLDMGKECELLQCKN